MAALVVAGCRSEQSRGFRDTFDVDKSALQSSGENQYFSLQPGKQLRFAAGDMSLTITVLDETRLVDGVETRVIEEREEQGGQTLEVSRNFFAIDPATNDVYYFGEEVDIFENGQLVSHEGAWLSGAEGARFGLIMPGEIEIGDRYFQEIAPDVALDRAENLAVDETVSTPAGTFQNSLHVIETSPLEPGSASEKWYAPGVGLIRDDEFVLVEVIEP